MTGNDVRILEYGALYRKALLAIRLRGIEGVPAKAMALEAVARHACDVSGERVVAGDIARLLRVSERAPFSLGDGVPVGSARAQAGKSSSAPGDDDDGRMASLLARLRQAVEVCQA